MEEKILIKKAKKGDAEAFGLLYQKVYKKLYQYALYVLHNEEDAKDVVSEAVMDAFASIGKLKKEECFENWIFRILSNKCKRQMREFYVYKTDLDEEVLEVQEKDHDGAMDVRQCFFRLDGVDSMIIAMHILYGYKTREIAEMLEMNENTVRSKEKRALEKMGKYLEYEALI